MPRPDQARYWRHWRGQQHLRWCRLTARLQHRHQAQLAWCLFPSRGLAFESVQHNCYSRSSQRRDEVDHTHPELGRLGYVLVAPEHPHRRLCQQSVLRWSLGSTDGRCGSSLQAASGRHCPTLQRSRLHHLVTVSRNRVGCRAGWLSPSKNTTSH
ncbi:hypothetical protein BKA82DRAFT_2460521 [Pisolithus tinctorius]|nr:hypothetical protein BKA82DRAFT_2460521 [Pisolithus tinctorius]